MLLAYPPSTKRLKADVRLNPSRCFFMKRTVILAIGLLAMVAVVGIILASRKGPALPTGGVGHRPGSSEDILPSIRETFQKGSGYLAFRNAVQQLNTYIDRNPEKKPEPLPDPEAVRKQFGLRADELAEVNSSSFTLLDAHYIDLCMLLR